MWTTCGLLCDQVSVYLHAVVVSLCIYTLWLCLCVFILCDCVTMYSQHGVSVTRSDLLLPQCGLPVVCFVTASLCIYTFNCVSVYLHCDCVSVYLSSVTVSLCIHSMMFLWSGLICCFLSVDYLWSALWLCLCVFTCCDCVSVYWQRVSVTRADLLLPQCPPQRSHSGLPVVLPQPACHQGQTTRNWRSAGSLALPFPSRPCWGGGDTGTTLVLCGISERRLRSEAGVARSVPWGGGGGGGICAFPWKLDQQ